MQHDEGAAALGDQGPSGLTGGRGLERRGGVQLWRQIAELMRQAIATGEFQGMMPPETVLAARFGVNRHTVRSALSALARDGLVQPVQGRGTLILKQERLSYPIGRRTRFSDGLAGQVETVSFRLISSGSMAVSGDVADALRLDPATTCPILKTLGLADGVPLSRASHVFVPRLAEVSELFSRLGSITMALKELGVADYIRLSTEVTARHAMAAEAAELASAPGAILLEIHAVNALPGGEPIQYSRTLFPADRVKLNLRTDPQ